MILTLSNRFLCLVYILYCMKPFSVRMIREPFKIVSLIWIHNDLSTSVPGEPVSSQIWHETLLLMHFFQIYFILFFLFLLCFEFFPLIVLKIRFFKLAHSREGSSRKFRIYCFQMILLPFYDLFKHDQARTNWGSLFSSKLIDSFNSLLYFIEIHVSDITVRDI